MQRTRRTLAGLLITSSVVIGAQSFVVSHAAAVNKALAQVLISQLNPEISSHGQVVTIIGSGFSTKFSQNHVQFSGASEDATVLNATTQKLSVLVPEDATTGPITVSIGKLSGTSPSPLSIVDLPNSELCNLTTDASRQITPQMLGKTGGKFTNGPTVIKVPEWVEGPLGTFYMYIADHRGLGIRLAFSDLLGGPWTVSSDPVLRLSKTLGIKGHIASPDIYVDNDAQKIYMTVHGLPISTMYKNQISVLVESPDGSTFSQDASYAGSIWATIAYARILKIDGTFVRIDPGTHQVSRSDSIMGPFSSPVSYSLPVNREYRHASVALDGSTIMIYYTRVRDAPERIYRATIDSRQPWGQWALTNEECVRRPEISWEGAQFPVEFSKDGPANSVNQLRDPFIYDDGINRALFYSYAGESGIAVAMFTE